MEKPTNKLTIGGKKMKKILTLGIVSLLLVTIVMAISLNIAAHTKVDFGTMQSNEKKTLGYYVKGYYENNGEYYSVCVKHEIEGEIKDWIKLDLDETNNLNIFEGQTCHKGKAFNEHWVGAEITPTWKKNVFVTLKVPPKTLIGNYTATISNLGCSNGICANVPTTIKVEII